ncbi:hypothetical protein [Actinosynnema sp. NPDC020468]|uniref:hypothetical protein n=1 Tax=Actinosynnema sp. NPDC020468 TaxID=3154488 RepID=UPI0033CF082B
MRIAGHYAELWPAAAGRPSGSIRDFTGDEREPDADRITHYLSNGSVIYEIMGVRPDLFEPTKTIIGSSVTTDGVWVWRDGLAYYFRKYHVRLEPEFLAHIRSQDYQVPPVPIDRMTELADRLDEFL